MKLINQKISIQAVSFASKNPEELAAFYQQAFNIPVAKKVDKDHLGIQLEDFYLGFDRIKEKAKPGPGGIVVWFYVDNVEEMFTHLVGLGARVRTNVNRDERPGQALAVLYDPDGNMIGLMGPSVPQEK